MATVELTHVRNLTSQTDIFKSGDDKCLDVVFMDQNSLVFHVPSTAKPGHQVEMKGQVIIKKKPFKFEATGKISSINPDDEHSHRVEIHLHQFDKLLWKNMLLQQQEDRARFDKIFDSMRGEDEK